MSWLIRSVKFILILCLTSFFLTGCWDRAEVNDLALILAAGIDKGKKNNIELSAQIFIPRAPQGGQQSGMSSGGSTGQSFVRSAEGETIADAMARLQEELTREIFWGQNEVLIIGETLAKEGISDHIDFWIRHSEPRIRADVFVSKGRSKTVLEAMPELERYTSKQLRKMVKTHIGVKVTVKDLSQMLSGASDAAVLPWVENLDPSMMDSKKAIPIINGAAIFKEGKMVGRLDDKQTRGILWPKNEIQSGVITISFKNEPGYISLNLLRSHSELIPTIKNGKWGMHMKSNVDLEVIQNTTTLNLFDPKVRKKAEQKVGLEIEQRERLAFSIVKKELHADIFGFADEFQREYPQIWKQKEDKWDEIFPKVAISFGTKVNISRTGLATEKRKTGVER
ncbi:germination protein, Ger(x)C family [Neobacillus bataviensis LMG 21833]|uniref:Germination protein, Ger(X)C family n=1 Tax=Neobacillus bataviensis LMG 21833 TaxID=1117379 RepID=K6C623_9BACI|nr:Ger(x)C family spore germination protein [Neobacillus bataviensis]EKN66555.1 germination protein, Ger(x)C family [Neobacillus bataviensis LMG 21833]